VTHQLALCAAEVAQSAKTQLHRGAV